MDFKFTHLDKTHTVKIDKVGDNYKAIVDNITYEVTDFEQQQNVISFKFKDKVYNIYFAEDKGKIYLVINGNYFVLEIEKKMVSKSKGTALQKGDSVSSPMPGLLVKIPVELGESVSSGTTLVIVEAMKMQNELRASCDGVVKKINFKEGDQVDAFVPIVELE